MITSTAYKAGYETGYHGHRPMTRREYTGGARNLEVHWRDYQRGLRDGKTDKEDGYKYNHGEEAKCTDAIG